MTSMDTEQDKKSEGWLQHSGARESSHSRKYTQRRGESGLLLPALLMDQTQGIYR